MNNDFSELIQYLDDKFTDVDKHLVKLDNDFNNLANAVDAYAQKADTYFQEMVVLSHKVDRHEKWLLEIAEKLGVKLKY
ncbi:MAG: hypothetical protein UV53_C0002G0031 [Candidatus Azambacteria bacterium GW2011_GWE1_42_9]|nr:MAG: hypothetical protein UU33_C0001G0078 [Candidatus Azambacteria bacterium GW2011_GWF1_41_10]KKS49149.1 MAG: hypothetical protein UV14_C0002G0146 [Candidatus Azambacteria bacterium GW2011_GWF2_42_22]KKS79725.1 MAG: hypothetical protein UV53_C0002G0031 [Candidatus Azambacteria bacterium GW2011_GWE1_42_9]KKT03272.1 MAG: hypothetical protein UV81_C0002G0025 [Candidatus Azambacteria bacterium GW2011_GWD1_43_18]KKT12651.1 MAG: hypothetical protein UV93_C0002G0049 [Candidatus Azambacteria bacter